MEGSVANNRQDFNQLSIKDVIYKYLRYLPLFAFCVGLTLLGAWLYLRYATLVYKAEGVMQIKEEKSVQSSDKVEELLEGGNRVSNIQSEIEVLRSVPLMMRVVDKLKLNYGYTSIGTVKNSNIYNGSPFLAEFFQVADSTQPFSIKIKCIDANRFAINSEEDNFHYGDVLKNSKGVFRLIRKSNPNPGTEFILSYTPVEAISRSLLRELTVSPKSIGTGSLILTMHTTNPRMSADIVNRVMVEYDSMSIEQSNYSSDQTLKFIDDRLGILGKEIDSLQQLVLDYQQKNNIIDATAQTTAYFDKITESDKLIAEQQLRGNVADMITAYLGNQNNQFNRVPVPSSLGLDDVTLNALVTQYNQAQQERKALIDAQIPPAHPNVKAVDGQIELLRQSTLENLRNIKGSILNTVATIQRRSSGAEYDIQKLPYKLKEFAELQRLVQTKAGLYTLLEEKREQAAITKASTISNTKVIDQAIPQIIPVKPDKRMVLLLAILVGIGVPAVIIFISELFNDKVNTRGDIERATSVPILGEVGNSGKETMMVVTKNSRSLVAEQFRIIRSNLQYILPNVRKPVIMVTSSFSGEGKSFVCSNMGAVISLTGKKTVVLEMDIRKPKVMEGLGLKELKRKGLVTYLVGKAEMEELVLPVPGYDNFYVLPCGPIPPNPAELLLTNKMADMFEWLRSNFDYVLVDTAPVGMVSDALAIGKYADCALYVVRQEYTYKRQLDIIDELAKESKLPHPSIILNDIKTRGGYGYYGSGRYGYGNYGYGSNGYYDDNKEKSFFREAIYYLKPTNWLKPKRD